jgi:RHS repeat-associated protein
LSPARNTNPFRGTERGAPTASYIRTLSIDEPLARVELGSGAVRHYLADALGSVTALADENGAVKTTYSYDPFGQVAAGGEASDNPFQYTGRENDATGLYYYRARYYSPELQRFISEDPIGDGFNFYAYIDNNPVNSTDPMGLFGPPWFHFDVRPLKLVKEEIERRYYKLPYLVNLPPCSPCNGGDVINATIAYASSWDKDKSVTTDSFMEYLIITHTTTVYAHLYKQIMVCNGRSWIQTYSKYVDRIPYMTETIIRWYIKSKSLLDENIPPAPPG